MTDEYHEPAPAQPDRRWIGPALLVALVVAPIVILVLSNTETATISWAGFDWEAPLWLLLTATFAAGVVGGRLFAWAWRRWRRRRRRIADEREVLRRHAPQEPEG